METLLIAETDAAASATYKMYCFHYSTNEQKVKENSDFAPIPEKIILNAKGSESLPTHYFFT